MAIISPLKKIFNWQTASEKIPYKTYMAKFTQTGTNDPVVKVLYNDTGITVTWKRLQVGTYVGNFSKNVSPSKFVIPGSFDYQGNSTQLITLGNPTVSGSMMYYELDNGSTLFGIEIDTYDTMGVSEEFSNLVSPGNFNVEFRIYN